MKAKPAESLRSAEIRRLCDRLDAGEDVADAIRREAASLPGGRNCPESPFEDSVTASDVATSVGVGVRTVQRWGRQILMFDEPVELATGALLTTARMSASGRFFFDAGEVEVARRLSEPKTAAARSPVEKIRDKPANASDATWPPKKSARGEP